MSSRTQSPNDARDGEEECKGRVLIVEDEPAFARILRKRLESNGYSVLSASDGEEGLQVAREQVPDVILSDWMMPRMTSALMTVKGSIVLREINEVKVVTRIQTLTLVVTVIRTHTLVVIQIQTLILIKYVTKNAAVTRNKSLFTQT